MFWLKRFIDGPRVGKPEKWHEENFYLSAKLDNEIYTFRCKIIRGDNSTIQLSVLDTQKFIWRHHDLHVKLNEGRYWIVSVNERNGLIYVFLVRDSDSEFLAMTFSPKDFSLTPLIMEGNFPEFEIFPYTLSAVSNKLYVCDQGEMHVFDFETHRWSRLETSGTKPQSYLAGSVVAFGTKIYIWGGVREINNEPDFYNCQMYVFDTRTNCFEVVEARGDIPVGRWGHSMFIYGRKIFVFGGYNSNGVNADETYENKEKMRSYLNQLFCFDIDTRTWKKCKPFGASIGFNQTHKNVYPSFEVIGSFAFLFGGDSVECDFISKQWYLAKPQDEWFVLDLQLSLKNFCIQELQKNESLSISKLPPGLRRNFIQQCNEEADDVQKQMRPFVHSLFFSDFLCISMFSILIPAIVSFIFYCVS